MSKPPLEADCILEQANLSKCIKSDVPAFQKVHSLCAGKLQGYEACLKTNKGSLAKCQADLKELRECALGAVSK